jgi:hypothetical protein
MSPAGVLFTVGATGGLLAVVTLFSNLVPPAPMAMPESAVGHGTQGSYECLPPSSHQIPQNQLDGLRCGSWIVEPGGLKENVIHVWKHGGETVARMKPERRTCEGDGVVFLTTLPQEKLDAIGDPRGMWSCVTETEGGQLVGIRKFWVVAPYVPPPPAGLDAGVPAPVDATPH